MRNNTRLILFLLLWATATMALAQSQPLVSVDRTTVAEGGTLTLRIRSHNPEATLNTRSLSTDFRIVDRRTDTNNPALEAPGENYQEWALELEPRRTGTLTIPPVLVDGVPTGTITIRVIPVSPEQQQFRDQLIEAELSVDQTDLYVDETTVVTLTLYYNVNIDGEFRDVQPGAGRWEPVGGAQTGSSRWQDGRRVNFHRFHYLYTPLESGNQTLPPIEFDGTYRTHGFSGPRPITVATDPVSLRISPIPDEFPAGAAWLPAQRVTLNDSWTTSPPRLGPGETVERRLELQTSGPASDRLPSLLPAAPDPAPLEQFADPPRKSESATADGYQSSITRTLLYRNRHAARDDVSITVPAVEIPWWNTRTDSLEIARVPEHRLTLQGEEDAAAGSAAEPSAGGSGPLPWGSLLRWGLIGTGLILAAVVATVWRRRWRHSEVDVRASTSGRLPEPVTDSTNWRDAIRPLVERSDWQALEQQLAHRWQSDGWPDAEALERLMQARGLAEALRETRARLYARPNERPSDERLRALWLAVLDGGR